MKPYPTFIIDRGRNSATSRFSNGFVVCTDSEMPFIAQVHQLSDESSADFEKKLGDFSEAERIVRYATNRIGDKIYVLEILDMFNRSSTSIERLPSLMKKALRAYICAK